MKEKAVFHAKKMFGQHFLTDRNIIAKIIESAGLTPQDKVWEVGGGRGILTEALVAMGCDVTVFEIDYILQDYLRDTFGSQIHLVAGDVLRVNWEKLFPPERLHIVANIPYQITSPLLFRIAKYHAHFQQVVIMIQKEVAERIVARADTKDYGILSLKMQYYFHVQYLFSVPPTVFSPPPKVDSAVIRLVPRLDAPFLENPDRFWKMVELAFGQRRKMLRNNLKPFVDEATYARLIDASPIDLKRRGETLNEEDYLLLYHL
jgi:16S rRNA (adenine1518-N6/adenine1519-N6)-dimethyltransferase